VPGLGFGYTDFVIMQIVGVVFFGIFTLLSGPVADSVGRRKHDDEVGVAEPEAGHGGIRRLRAVREGFPLGEVIRSNWKNLILGTFIMLATYVLFYLPTGRR
jgi:hypothetical protein